MVLPFRREDWLYESYVYTSSAASQNITTFRFIAVACSSKQADHKKQQEKKKLLFLHSCTSEGNQPIPKRRGKMRYHCTLFFLSPITNLAKIMQDGVQFCCI